MDPTLLWLRRRLAATALIRSLAWEPPYAMGAALEKNTKRPKKKKKKKVSWQPPCWLQPASICTLSPDPTTLLAAGPAEEGGDLPHTQTPQR